MAGAQRRHVCCEQQVQVVVAVEAPSRGGGGGGADMGGGADAGIHPEGVIQCQVEEVASNGKPVADGVAAEGPGPLASV